MKAYGNYIIALKYRLRRSAGSDMSPIDITQVCEDLHADLHHLCHGRDMPIFLVENLVYGIGQILKEDRVSDWGATHE